MADTTSTLSVELKTFYDSVLLHRAVPNLVHTQFGQKRNIPGGSGRAIEFRRFGSLAAATAALTEGTVPAATSMAVSSVTATVAQYGSGRSRIKTLFDLLAKFLVGIAGKSKYCLGSVSVIVLPQRCYDGSI